MARVESLKIEIYGLSATNEELQMEIWEVVANGGSWPREVPRLQIQKAKPFNGARDSKVFDNFIRKMEHYFFFFFNSKMEQYLKASKMEDKGEKVKTCILCLIDGR